MPKSPEGVLPVLATPFTADGDIDAATLADEIEWVLAQKVDGVVLGMVSEVLRLSSEERDRLTEATCAAVDGRATVTASVGAESLHTAVRHARHAEASGATALMAIPPLATACDDDELFRYYAGIFDAVGIPVVVQDASGYLGRPLSIELQARLLRDYGDRALFKPEAQPIGPRLSALRDATDGSARVYEGTGGLALVDSFTRGIAGTMPGPDICWALVALWKALETGDAALVDALNGPLSALVSIQNSLDSFVSVQKHLLRRQGVLSHTYSRGPVGYLVDPETEREVDRRFDVLAEAYGAGVVI
ncbi:dihydrodipicolinate synthase family protein [Actinomadura madurae]|uniref:dihydrodipicolinate synthase family protein n=1 Tax=Actinomadura madurae TaxID=1993 RepID=UPI000D937831|nr:dihydrodipicolinate synthase family protein [Actinomadura madurae]SPT51479.1 dihydrodipicolinate synthase [Actinomadura madurae]